MDWKKYEEYTALILENINSLNDVKIISKGKNSTVSGKSECKHQIDVYISFKNNDGVNSKAIIECKYYKNKISIGKIRDFLSVRNDIGNVEGWFITPNGYQNGAKKFADYYGIKLMTLQELKVYIIKSNTPPPTIVYRAIEIDNIFYEYSSENLFTITNLDTNKTYSFMDFIKLYKSRKQLITSTKNKIKINSIGNYFIDLIDGRVKVDSFTFHYRIISHNPATISINMDDTYEIKELNKVGSLYKVSSDENIKKQEPPNITLTKTIK